MKLYSGPLSMFGAKVEIAAREKGLNFALEMVAFSQKQGYNPKHPEVLRINPKAQVPVWVDASVELYDSTQIFEYLEDRWPTPPLWPSAADERARARLLEHASDEVFFPNVVKLMGLRANPDPVDSPEWRQARTRIEAYYVTMEQALERGPFLARVYTYADIAFYMAQFFAARHTVPISEAHKKLRAWRSRVAGRAAVNQVISSMVTYLRSIDYAVPEFD
jgi:glutathione S-transferase